MRSFYYLFSVSSFLAFPRLLVVSLSVAQTLGGWRGRAQKPEEGERRRKRTERGEGRSGAKRRRTEAGGEAQKGGGGPERSGA